MFLGIEIGGTKLQLGVSDGRSARLVALERADVTPSHGAAGIRDNIERIGKKLIAAHCVQGVGYGFGGPIDLNRGIAVKSHHIQGWDGFPLLQWTRELFNLPVALGNDCDVACLAEARFGAAKGESPVFYVTVGTGIGGGLVIDDDIYRGSGVGASEIGHLRPGLNADQPGEIVEKFSAGWGITAAAQARLEGPVSRRVPTSATEQGVRDPESIRRRLMKEDRSEESFAADLLRRCENQPELLTTKIIGEAATAGNGIAVEILERAFQTLGWAVAQMINLLAPRVVVIGGGVSLMGEERFFTPVRKEVERYLFPPFADSYRIVPAALGEESVVHGACALAAGKR